MLKIERRKYALELVSEVGLPRAKPANTPIDKNDNLTSRNVIKY